MIRKQDILDRSVEWQLRPEVVEKDYVLGWLLAGLAQMPFGELWIFKGVEDDDGDDEGDEDDS